MDETSRHQCLIYEGSPSPQLRELATATVQKLAERRRCLFLNSPAMIAGLRVYLAASGLDVEREVMKGSLVLSSDQNHLINGDFNVDRMLEMLAGQLQRALKDGYAGLWATGDMTWEMGSEKNFEKLMSYERALEEFLNDEPALSGICQYHMDTLPADCRRQALCTHRAVFVNATLSRVNPR